MHVRICNFPLPWCCIYWAAPATAPFPLVRLRLLGRAGLRDEHGAIRFVRAPVGALAVQAAASEPLAPAARLEPLPSAVRVSARSACAAPGTQSAQRELPSL